MKSILEEGAERPAKPLSARRQLKHLKVWLQERDRLLDQWLRRAVLSQDSQGYLQPHQLMAATGARAALAEFLDQMDELATAPAEADDYQEDED